MVWVQIRARCSGRVSSLSEASLNTGVLLQEESSGPYRRYIVQRLTPRLCRIQIFNADTLSNA